MARIIVIVDNDQDLQDKITKTLKGNEVIFVAPSPANFLHLCLGMLPDDPNDGITSAEIDEPENDEENPDDSAKDDGAEPEDDSTEEIPECKIFDEVLKVTLCEDEESSLHCNFQDIDHERLTLKLNESEITGWKTENRPHLFSVDLSVNNKKTLVSIPLIKSESAPELKIGKDLIHLFSTNDN